MSITSAFISHQIWLQRTASHEANLSIPFIQQMRDEVKDAVLKFGDDSRTAARLNRMLSDLDDILRGIATGWNDALLNDLQELASYEAEWTTKTLTANVEANFTTPSPEQVWSAIKFEPLSLGEKPVDFVSLLDNWKESEVQRLTAGVKSGFVQGLTTRQIVKNVVGDGGLADVSQRGAMAVVKTAMNHVSTVAKDATYEKNSDIVEGYELVVTLDSRTSAICRGWPPGKVYKLDSKYQPKPPFHIACLSLDTDVSTCSAVSNVYKRTYKGRMVNIRTASGRSLSVTPNHPVLTTVGWVAAGDLNLFSKLICCNDAVSITKHQEDNVIANIADVFSAVDVSADALSVTYCPSSAEYFHGDGADSEVKIVSVDSLAWDKVKAALNKEVLDDNLPFRKSTYSSLSGDGSVDKLLVSGNPSSVGHVCCGSEAGNLLRGAICHSDGHGLASVSHPDSGFKNPDHWTLASADDLANFDWTNASGIEIDDVADLSFTEVYLGGHVYNLENENNWYVANGIITHNCRTTTAPVISSEFDFLDAGAKRAARGADGGMQVDANTSYYDFLKSQPAWFQDEALGPIRGKIFRESGMSPEQFRAASIDGFNRPMTIQQMAENDKLVADYLAKINYKIN